MAVLDHKIDFVAFLSVTNANPNGDPLTGNIPRLDREGHGEMTAECLKRKIRNRMQDMGHAIAVVANDRITDGCGSVQGRLESVQYGLGSVKAFAGDETAYRDAVCAKFMDIRAFGSVLAWKGEKRGDGVSIPIRGPVSLWDARSVDPVMVRDIQITKSTNGLESEKGDRGSDTMGMKHSVEYGLYRVQGSVSPRLAACTGFSDEDASILKECLRTLFVGDSSAARPEGTMEVAKLFWAEHGCALGQYSSARVFRSVRVDLRPGRVFPSSLSDYEIFVDDLPGLYIEDVSGVL